MMSFSTSTIGSLLPVLSLLFLSGSSYNNNNNRFLSVADALALPAQELVNRRKSPALWRYDLSHNNNNDDVDKNKIQDNAQQHHKKKHRVILRPPEVMSPVGGWPQMNAAIANGADAVYVGLSAFSARARAANFDPHTELPEAVATCHNAGVKLYVALNTLVFANELVEIEALIRQCAVAKVDALIVQDLGVARLAKRIAPGLELHASTQQTITSADGATFIAGWMESSRVVLGRELSVAEIESVASDLQESYESNENNLQEVIDAPVEVEAFVHGALCVSYSGQCFSSEFAGGRSANRGQCAQACRLPYGLIDNGDLIELGDFSYLLSPQDLCGLDHVPAMVRAGVACLKIEGRLKDAAYVAATTRAYRNAVDVAWREYQDELVAEHGDNAIEDNVPIVPQRQLSLPNESVSKAELAQLFSRGQDETHDGLSAGFFDGSKHQDLVRGRSPRHRGVHIGRIVAGTSWRNGLYVALDNDDSSNHDDPDGMEVKRGDGLVVDRGLAQEEELGGPIFDIIPMSQKHEGKRVVQIRLSKGVEKKWKDLDDEARHFGDDVPEHAPVGAHVWKTSDATVDKKMKRLIEAAPPIFAKLAHVTVTGSIGAPLVVTITDDATGRQGVSSSEGVLQSAEKKGLEGKAIRKAIGLLGNTEWALASDDNAIDTSGVDAEAWCPASWIKEARRNAVEDLQSQFASQSVEQPSVQDDKDDSNLGSEQGSSVTKELLEAFSRSNSIASDNDAGDEQTEKRSRSKLSVLARNFAQVETICDMVDNGEGNGVDEIMVDFLEIDGMRDAVKRIRRTPSIKVVVASPRIIKPGESGIWRTLLRLKADGLLVRSTGLLHRMMQLGGEGAEIDVGVSQLEGEDEVDSQENLVLIPELIGDFSLNVANPLTAWELLTYGCSRVTASFDLNANGITELLQSMGNGKDGAAKVEVVAHAHLPIFHTEHCVFARFLTKGNSYLDCGHVCTNHNVHLRDQNGADNLVLADLGCRNTVFGSEAQSGVNSLKEWRTAGATRFRIELVDEGSEDVELIVGGYLSVLDGEQRASAVWESLKNVRDSNGRTGGVSHGSLRNTPVRRAGELEVSN